MTNADTAWDDIVVGAGTAGCVLASRLSQAPQRRVLLIEAGPDFPSPASLPECLADARAPVRSGFHWDHVAQLRSGGKPVPYSVGKLVGGSSAINGALALRGLKEDFDAWAGLGNPDWCWDAVRPWFERIETDHVPITRPRPDELHPVQAAFMRACRTQGLEELADLNASSAAGVGPVPSNSVNQRRVSTAQAYLAPARRRSNLQILSGCTVQRIVFDGTQAVGVQCMVGDRSTLLRGALVSLCAGAIGTPLLLQRSGVADRRRCEELGIPPVLHLPGVGENLADHATVTVWMTPRDGGVSSEAAHHQAMARVASAGEPADMTLFLLSDVPTASFPPLDRLLGIPRAHGIAVMLGRPASRGRVFMRDTAPSAGPAIELNLGAAPSDIDRLMHGVRLAARIARSPSMAELTTGVCAWTETVLSNDNLLRRAIEHAISSAWHATGTARMGPESDPLAVVDQRGRVHGIQNLWIADASVMPLIPTGPTQLSCIVVAERVAHWMQQTYAGMGLER